MTAEEIATLDLSETEWVVLSTCDSGLGTTVPSEGIFGLRRSFEIAGARNVVASVWPVDDVITLEWMVALHRLRTAHDLDAATSVRDAALECLARRRSAGQSDHPYFWGAFFATGT